MNESQKLAQLRARLAADSSGDMDILNDMGSMLSKGGYSTTPVILPSNSSSNEVDALRSRFAQANADDLRILEIADTTLSQSTDDIGIMPMQSQTYMGPVTEEPLHHVVKQLTSTVGLNMLAQMQQQMMSMQKSNMDMERKMIDQEYKNLELQKQLHHIQTQQSQQRNMQYNIQQQQPQSNVIPPSGMVVQSIPIQNQQQQQQQQQMEIQPPPMFDDSGIVQPVIINENNNIVEENDNIPEAKSHDELVGDAPVGPNDVLDDDVLDDDVNQPEQVEDEIDENKEKQVVVIDNDIEEVKEPMLYICFDYLDDIINDEKETKKCNIICSIHNYPGKEIQTDIKQLNTIYDLVEKEKEQSDIPTIINKKKFQVKLNSDDVISIPLSLFSQPHEQIYITFTIDFFKNENEKKEQQYKLWCVCNLLALNSEQQIETNAGYWKIQLFKYPMLLHNDDNDNHAYNFSDESYGIMYLRIMDILTKLDDFEEKKNEYILVEEKSILIDPVTQRVIQNEKPIVTQRQTITQRQAITQRQLQIEKEEEEKQDINHFKCGVKLVQALYAGNKTFLRCKVQLFALLREHNQSKPVYLGNSEWYSHCIRIGNTGHDGVVTYMEKHGFTVREDDFSVHLLFEFYARNVLCCNHMMQNKDDIACCTDITEEDELVGWSVLHVLTPEQVMNIGKHTLQTYSGEVNLESLLDKNMNECCVLNDELYFEIRMYEYDENNENDNDNNDSSVTLEQLNTPAFLALEDPDTPNIPYSFDDDDDDNNNKQKSIKIKIDRCLTLPRNCTVTRCVAEIISEDEVVETHSQICDVLEYIYNPWYQLNFDIKEELYPDSMLHVRIETIDPKTLKLYIVGTAVLPLFSELAEDENEKEKELLENSDNNDEKKSKKSNEENVGEGESKTTTVKQMIVVNIGSFQLPLYNDDSFNLDCFDDYPEYSHVPGARLLIRVSMSNEEINNNDEDDDDDCDMPDYYGSDGKGVYRVLECTFEDEIVLISSLFLVPDEPVIKLTEILSGIKKKKNKKIFNKPIDCRIYILELFHSIDTNKKKSLGLLYAQYPHNINTGIAISIDSMQHMPSRGVPVVIATCLTSDNILSEATKKTAFFNQRLNWQSAVKYPKWSDGFTVIRGVKDDNHALLILQINILTLSDQLEIESNPYGWIAIPLFHENSLKTGYFVLEQSFQLPLFRGSPSETMLTELLKTNHVQTVYENEEYVEQLNIVPRVSAFVRVCDAQNLHRAEAKFPIVTSENKLMEIDRTFLHIDSLSQYKFKMASNTSTILDSFIPVNHDINEAEREIKKHILEMTGISSKAMQRRYSVVN